MEGRILHVGDGNKVGDLDLIPVAQVETGGEFL